jgi:hypothetical protein
VRVRGDIIQRYEPSRDDIQTAILEFEDGYPDTEITDPPVMRVVTVNEIRDFGSPLRSAMLDSSTTEALIVWNGSPGPDWQPLPGNTCRPGEYEIVTLSNRSEERSSWRDAYEARWSSDQRRLQWPPQRATQRRPLTVAEAEQALRDVSRTVQVYRGQLDDTVLAFERFEEAARINREQVQQLYAVPPEILLTPPPRPRRQPLPPQTARVAWNPDGSRTYTFDAPTGTYDAVVFQDGTEVPFPTITMASQGQVIVTVSADNTVIPDSQPRLRRALGDPNRARYARVDTRWEASPALTDPRLNPEKKVLDSIEELVNDQITRAAPRGVPLDDYDTDRYPECKECGHDWHGLECDPEDGSCECINTDWLGPDQRTKHLDLDEPTPLEIQRPEGTRIRNLDMDW